MADCAIRGAALHRQSPRISLRFAEGIHPDQSGRHCAVAYVRPRSWRRGPISIAANCKRGVDPQALISRPLAPPRALTRAQRRHVLDAGRAMLASLGRETDALAAAEPEGVEYHVLGRGVAIALYTMAPGRRLPLDSHVGFMLFKNSLPVGYGGAWPFLGTAKVGVNSSRRFAAANPPTCSARCCACMASASGSIISLPSRRNSAAATVKASSPAPSGSTTGWDSGRSTPALAALAAAGIRRGCATLGLPAAACR